jgi:hypothetical protein
MIEKRIIKKLTLNRKSLREKINDRILKRMKIKETTNNTPKQKAKRRTYAGVIFKRIFLTSIILSLFVLGTVIF